jgi:nitroreductase
MNREESLVARPFDTADSAVLARLMALRYSCRAYRAESIPRAVMERILELAQFTASWCNSQPWALIITEGSGTERFREALFTYASNHDLSEPRQTDFPFPTYSEVYKARRREVGWQLYDSVGVIRGDKAGANRQSLENFRLFGAPHVAIVTSDLGLGTYGAIDCGAYIGNFLLAAQSLGIASVPQASIAHHASFVRQYFDLPATRRIICGISFGYALSEEPINRFRTRRANLDEVVTWQTK